MNAIVYTRYGSPDVLQFKTVAKPQPKDHEVLIKVHAASVNAADWHLLRGDPFLMRFSFGLRTPKFPILGADIAGRIEAIGRGVTRFQPGDAVYGDLSAGSWGGFAEHVCAPETTIAPKPANLSFEQAAAVPLAAITALQGLRDHGKVQPAQRVLISGASGGVGTFALQIAKAWGADVTAVCSTRNLDMVRTLGADHVIDYTREDFTKRAEHYDLIVAVNGHRSIRSYQRALKPKGVYVMIGGSTAQIFQALLLGPLLSITGSNKLGAMIAKPNATDLAYVTELIEAGKMVPVIDRCYPLAEVADAIRYLENEHARGKVVIKVDHAGD